MSHSNALRVQQAAIAALRKKLHKLDDALLERMDREKRLTQLDSMTSDLDDAALAARYGLDGVS